MLYHREVGFPTVELPEGKVTLEYSEHAVQQAAYDINGKIHLSNILIIDPYRIFEIEMGQEGDIVKFAYRTRYNGRCDVTYILLPQENGTFFVKTVWLNERRDKHRTLNTSKYAVPV